MLCCYFVIFVTFVVCLFIFISLCPLRLRVNIFCLQERP